MNGSTGLPVDYELRSKRIKKGTFGLSGKVVMTDLPFDYTAEILVYHSPTRNNVYTLLPFKVPEGPAFVVMNTLYRRYVMKNLHAVSDFPYSEDPNEDLCLQFRKGQTNQMRNFIFNKDTLPKFVNTGMYKMHIMAKKNHMVQSGLEVFVDLS